MGNRGASSGNESSITAILFFRKEIGLKNSGSLLHCLSCGCLCSSHVVKLCVLTSSCHWSMYWGVYYKLLLGKPPGGKTNTFQDSARVQSLI